MRWLLLIAMLASPLSYMSYSKLEVKSVAYVSPISGHVTIEREGVYIVTSKVHKGKLKAAKQRLAILMKYRIHVTHLEIIKAKEDVYKESAKVYRIVVRGHVLKGDVPTYVTEGQIIVRGDK